MSAPPLAPWEPGLGPLDVWLSSECLRMGPPEMSTWPAGNYVLSSSVLADGSCWLPMGTATGGRDGWRSSRGAANTARLGGPLSAGAAGVCQSRRMPAAPRQRPPEPRLARGPWSSP